MVSYSLEPGATVAFLTPDIASDNAEEGELRGAGTIGYRLGTGDVYRRQYQVNARLHNGIVSGTVVNATGTKKTLLRFLIPVH